MHVNRRESGRSIKEAISLDSMSIDMSADANSGNKSKALNFWIIFYLGSWYIFSLITLFLNKIILMEPDGDKYVLGMTQMCFTATLGAVKVYGMKRSKSNTIIEGDEKHSTFNRDMILVGVMRGATVLLGLVSLAHVAVSFTETVKSSAPLFTVVFAKLILGEGTPWQVQVSLIPVMLGLAVCSATEISFDTIGFLAAVANNVVDCVQNVFSKKLLVNLTPIELQFYTSVAAAVIQMPMILYTFVPNLLTHENPMSYNMMMLLTIDGISFHMQSVTAYYTMSLLSPVSQSVANTLKRAILILLSILYFQNAVSFRLSHSQIRACIYTHAHAHTYINEWYWCAEKAPVHSSFSIFKQNYKRELSRKRRRRRMEGEGDGWERECVCVRKREERGRRGG
eukprot:m.132866 g.132866  ORF g.132866 m.132866 type:complete len:396 (-) comp29636_c0_seq1:8-1195(-)